jgi:hypothetical protein
MIADGLWRDRRHRLPSPHQPRRRRDCLGELVQIDGSEHAEVTNRICSNRLVASSTRTRTTRAYLEQHGKPVALYSDKHGSSG